MSALRLGLLVLAVGGAPLTSCSFTTGNINLTVRQTDLSPKSAPRDFKTIEIEVDNSGSAVARGIVIRDALPDGFRYVSTKPVAAATRAGGRSTKTSDAIRTRTSDPPINTPSPTWGSWSIPAGTVTAPGRLVLDFDVLVSASPGKTPNFVEVTSDDTDPVAAPPLALSVQPTAAMELLVTSKSPIFQGQTAHYIISLRNTGTAPGRGTFISAALPPGFIYGATSEIGGNSARIGRTDPLPKSLLPSWGTWDVPAPEVGGVAGTLQIGFDAAVVADEAPGSYRITVTITYNNLPAQTVADQAPVAVLRKV